MLKSYHIPVATLLVALLVGCAGPTPTTVPQPENTPAGPLTVSLSIDAVPGAAGTTEMTLTFANHDQEAVYLPICGPWEIYRDEDPERPSWFLACEIDYLGHRVPVGDTWRDRLVVKLEPGTYHARTQVYGDCEEQMESISCPTLVVWGEDDTVLSLSNAAWFGATIPGSRVEIIAGVTDQEGVPDWGGHHPMRFKSQEFNQILLDFLRST